MPNHFHGIIEILPPDIHRAPRAGAPTRGAPAATTVNDEFMICDENLHNDSESIPYDDFIQGQPQGIAPLPTLGDIVGAFKSISTVNYIRGVHKHNWKRFDRRLWQRNYWEDIIDTSSYFKNVTRYLLNNLAKWAIDKFNENRELIR